MPKPKLTKKKIREFIKDEKAGNKAYKKYGLTGLARDEARHRKFLENKLKNQNKRGLPKSAIRKERRLRKSIRRK